MLDLSFGSSALSKHVRHSDSRKYLGILSSATRTTIIERAADSAKTLFNGNCSLIRIPVPHRNVYTLEQFEHVIVVRKIAENLSASIRPFTPSRNSIVSSLRLLLAEGTRFNLYRLDLRKFYDSFDTASVMSRIAELGDVGQQTKVLLKVLLAKHNSLGGSGVPAGLPVSGVLSEMMMVAFDRSVQCCPEVYFYARFVDDIVILTNGREDKNSFRDFLRSKLPKGTAFGTNPSKTNVLSFLEPVQGGLPMLNFEYLGYSFGVSEAAPTAKPQRKAVIDLSAKSLARAQTRLVRTFQAFRKTGNYSLLEGRIAFLTTNCRMTDASTNIPKLVGVYHNHPHLSCGSGCGLHQLDGLLGSLISRSNRAQSSMKSLITHNQMSELLRHSFVAGFRNQRYRHFTRRSLSEISECWRYEK